MERGRSSTSDITGGGGGRAPLLVRSFSAGSSSTSGGVINQPKQSEERRREGWEQRVRRKAKEKRARFYLVRRCVHMLLCWSDDTKP